MHLAYQIKQPTQLLNLIKINYLTLLTCLIHTSFLPSKWKYNFWPKNDSEKGSLKTILKFLYAGDYFSLLHKSVQNHKFSNKKK